VDQSNPTGDRRCVARASWNCGAPSSGSGRRTSRSPLDRMAKPASGSRLCGDPSPPRSSSSLHLAEASRVDGCLGTRTTCSPESRLGMVPIPLRGHLDGAGGARRTVDCPVVRARRPETERRSAKVPSATQASSLIVPGLWRGAFDDPGREMYLRANPQIQGVGPWPTKPQRLRNRS